MSTGRADIRAYFAKLGLEPEVADIYIALHRQGPQTISELSRTSGVERTRIYRLLDQLKSSNLIEVEAHYKRDIIKPAPITNLQILISKKEQELKGLQDELPLIEQALAPQSLSSPATRVQFYQGPAGIKQMFWNQANATTDVRSILYENIQTKTDSKFFERWVTKRNVTQLKHRSIIGDTFLASQRHWYEHHDNERLKLWEARYAPKELFPILHSTVIYDDVVSYFTWKDHEIFGVELYNAELAASQQQLFELLWAQCEPYVPD